MSATDADTKKSSMSKIRPEEIAKLVPLTSLRRQAAAAKESGQRRGDTSRWAVPAWEGTRCRRACGAHRSQSVQENRKAGRGNLPRACASAMRPGDPARRGRAIIDATTRVASSAPNDDIVAVNVFNT